MNNKEEELEQLKLNSPYSLPDDTAFSNLTSAQIKEKFYKGLFYLYDLFTKLRDDNEIYMADAKEKIDTALALIQAFVDDDRATNDIDGNPIKTTYAKIIDLKNGVIPVLNYLKNDGTAGSIQQIATDLFNFTVQFYSYFDKDGKVKQAIAADNAKCDIYGQQIHTTYATKSDLQSTNQNINAITDEIAKDYIKKEQIVNNLTTENATAPLSATQGKLLKSEIDGLESDVQNNKLEVDEFIASTNAKFNGNKAKESEKSDIAYADEDGNNIKNTYTKKSDIVDNLTSTDTTKPLSANQGKVLKNLIDAINDLLESDDSSLNEIQEIVNYIKDNRELIQSITTTKVNVSDIINNLTSAISNKPLSANMGKVLSDELNELSNTLSSHIDIYNEFKQEVSNTYATKTDLNTANTNITNITENYINKNSIIDNLISTDISKPLSANQGKVLNDKIVSAEAEITKIKNGTIIVNKTYNDENGNNITDTYSTIAYVDSKLSDIDTFVQYPNGSLKTIVITAYNDEDFVNSIAFAFATDKDDNNNLLYGNIALITEEILEDENSNPIGAEYSMVCNGLIYHLVLKENGSDYDFEVSNPYFKKDDEVLTEAIKSVSDAKVAITSQYISQPSNVKEGSTIYINSKLRNSVNLFKVNSGQYASTASGSSFAVNIDENGTITFSGTTSANYEIINIPLQQSLQANKTYTYSLEKENPSNVVYSIRFRTSVSTDFVALDNNFTQKTYTSNYEIIKLEIAVNPNINYDGLVVKNIQIQEGNSKTSYEPYGVYSKGKVMQYASKNILNIAGLTNNPVAVAVNGSTYASQTIQKNDIGNIQFPMNGSQRYNTYYKNHRYLLIIHSTDDDFTHCERYGSGLWTEDYKFISNIGLNNYYIDTANKYFYAVAEWTAETQVGEFQPNFINSTINSMTIDIRTVVDLTKQGQHNFTAEQAYNFYNSKLSTLSAGSAATNGSTKQSALIKTFSNELYLTKTNTNYTLTICEFKENPSALNTNVDIDDYEFIKATDLTSSGAITLQATTNSIVYYVRKNDGTTISDSDLSTYQSTSQLEYGLSATAHSDYLAPIEIGEFDQSVDGETKLFSFKVLGTENQNIGFIPYDGYFTIDLASNADDYSKSTFSYSAYDIANEVANLKIKVQNLTNKVAELENQLTQSSISHGIIYLETNLGTSEFSGGSYLEVPIGNDIFTQIFLLTSNSPMSFMTENSLSATPFLTIPANNTNYQINISNNRITIYYTSSSGVQQSETENIPTNNGSIYIYCHNSTGLIAVQYF